MKKWYEGSKEPGVIALCKLFKVELNEFYKEAEIYRKYETKATKKNHIHKHRPAGSKLMKKHSRFAWDKANG